MKCSDCNGSGKYQGLGVPEFCQTCQGLGVIDLDQDLDKTSSLNSKSLVPELKTGDTIYIYSAGWHEAQVTNIENETDITYWPVKSTCQFRMHYSHINYNATQKRWEYIQKGIPVW